MCDSEKYQTGKMVKIIFKNRNPVRDCKPPSKRNIPQFTGKDIFIFIY